MQAIDYRTIPDSYTRFFQGEFGPYTCMFNYEVTQPEWRWSLGLRADVENSAIVAFWKDEAELAKNLHTNIENALINMWYIIPSWVSDKDLIKWMDDSEGTSPKTKAFINKYVIGKNIDAIKRDISSAREDTSTSALMLISSGSVHQVWETGQKAA